MRLGGAPRHKAAHMNASPKLHDGLEMVSDVYKVLELLAIIRDREDADNATPNTIQLWLTAICDEMDNVTAKRTIDHLSDQPQH